MEEEFTLEEYSQQRNNSNKNYRGRDRDKRDYHNNRNQRNQHFNNRNYNNSRNNHYDRNKNYNNRESFQTKFQSRNTDKQYFYVWKPEGQFEFFQIYIDALRKLGLKNLSNQDYEYETQKLSNRNQYVKFNRNILIYWAPYFHSNIYDFGRDNNVILNHFDDYEKLGDKDLLYQSLVKKYGEEETCKFHPKTYILDLQNENQDYQDEYKQKNLENILENIKQKYFQGEENKQHEVYCLIIKPTKGYQGKDVQVINQFSQITQYLKEQQKTFEKYQKSKKFVIQEYIQNPLLFKGTQVKYNFVVEVLIYKGVIYQYQNPKIRYGLFKYEKENQDIKVHVINDHLQGEDKEAYLFDQDDDFFGDLTKEEVLKMIKELAVKVVHANEDVYNSNLNFETIGLDMMLDDNKNLHLIEANSNPAVGSQNKEKNEEQMLQMIEIILDKKVPEDEQKKQFRGQNDCWKQIGTYEVIQNSNQFQKNQERDRSPINFKLNKQLYHIESVELIRFQQADKFSKNQFLKEMIQDQETMQWIGNSRTWDQQKLFQNLKWGEKDWEQWNENKKDPKYQHEYFQWLFYVKYKIKNDDGSLGKETKQNPIGIFQLQLKKNREFSNEKLYYGRQIMNRRFQGLGIGQKVMKQCIWDQIQYQGIKIDKFYNVVSPNNVGAIKMSEKVQGKNMGEYFMFGKNYVVYEFNNPNIQQENQKLNKFFVWTSEKEGVNNYLKFYIKACEAHGLEQVNERERIMEMQLQGDKIYKGDYLQNIKLRVFPYYYENVYKFVKQNQNYILNHFPETDQFEDKAISYQNLLKLYGQQIVDEFNPVTFIINNINDYQKQLKPVEQYLQNIQEKSDDYKLIIKPASGRKGQQIGLCKNIDDVKEYFENQIKNQQKSKYKQYIVQQYINQPKKLEGKYKFHYRVDCLFFKGKVYLFNNPRIQKSLTEYGTDFNSFVTNPHLQGFDNHEEFNSHSDEFYKTKTKDEIINEFKQIAEKVFKAQKHVFNKSNILLNSCFEMVGLDIVMQDESQKEKIFLLEQNINPGLANNHPDYASSQMEQALSIILENKLNKTYNNGSWELVADIF